MAFFDKLLGKDTTPPSKITAKERLRVVLVHDRASMSPNLLATLKTEMLNVISKYMEIDKDKLEVNLSDNENDSMALTANIPVNQVKRND